MLHPKCLEDHVLLLVQRAKLELYGSHHVPWCEQHLGAVQSSLDQGQHCIDVFVRVSYWKMAVIASLEYLGLNESCHEPSTISIADLLGLSSCTGTKQ